MQRKFLALLLVRAGQPVHVHELIEELWGDDPPSTAGAALQTYAMQLRKRLKPMLTDGTDVKELLATVPMGYTFRLPLMRLDLHEFEVAAEAGRTAFLAGDYLTARTEIKRALALWRGPALNDLPRGRHLATFVAQVEEQRLHMEELRIDTDLHLGHHRECLGPLLTLTSRHHLNEALHSRLMLALYRSGRRSDALTTYRRLESRMASTVGMRPAHSVRRLYDAILRDESELASLAMGHQARTAGPTAHH